MEQHAFIHTHLTPTRQSANETRKHMKHTRHFLGTPEFFFRASVACLLLCTAQLAAAEDTPDLAMELTASTLKSQGDYVVNSALLTYTIASVAQPAPQDLVQFAVDRAKTALGEEIEKTNDEVRREALKAHLRDIEANARRQLQESVESSLDVHFAMSGPALGGDRYFEITQRRKGFPPRPMEVSYRRLGGADCIAINNEREVSTVLIEDKLVYYGSEEPHRLGRAIGLLESLAQAASASNRSLRDSVRDMKVTNADAFQGNPSFEIEVVYGDPASPAVGSTTFITVPALGYVTPLVRDYLPDGTLLSEWKSTEYIAVPQKLGAPIWFPLHVSFERYNDDSGPIQQEHYRFKADALSFNDSPSADRFRISLSPQMTVTDTRVSPAVSYSVHESMTLGLDEVDSLGANPILERVRVRSLADSPAPTPSWRWPGGLVLNFAIVAALAGALWWRSRRVAAVVLLIALAMPGCGFDAGVVIPEACPDVFWEQFMTWNNGPRCS